MVLEGGLKNHHVLCCGWAFDLHQVGQLKPSPMHVFFFFEGKTERLCYVAMLQKQVPKFLKMSTPMNLAARRRAAICNLGKELKVNGFPWSGRLGADNQFVLFVQVYDNEGHKANAVQRQETPSTRSITSGSKPVEAIGHYESHMEPPPNLQTEATCQ